LTTPLRHFEVGVAALYALGGATKAIDTEDLAVRCHQLAPSLFAWQKYKQQINLELVRVCLSDAKKQKNGGLVSGSGREGWRLTAKGLDWVKNNAGRLQSLDGIRDKQSKAGSIDHVRRERERARIQMSNAWGAWMADRVITATLAREVLRVDDYTTPKMLQIKVARLRAMFEGDAQLSPFLETLGKQVFLKGDA
jgi:hypothetical protein